jgi:hypothetical protein
MRLRVAVLAALLVPATAVLAQDQPAKPKLTAVSLTPAAFTPNRTGPTIAKHGGAVVRFTVDTDVGMTMGVERRTKAGTWKVYPGGESFDAKAGTHSFRFSGRINGVTLHPGRYRLSLIGAEPTMGTPTNLVYRPFRIKG